MRRAAVALVLLLAAGALGGCDRCGNWRGINVPGMPAGCSMPAPGG
jgi:hypothetical protein